MQSVPRESAPRGRLTRRELFLLATPLVAMAGILWSPRLRQGVLRATGQPRVLSIPQRRVNSLAISPDSKLLAVACDGTLFTPGSVCIWDIARAAPVHTIENLAGTVFFVQFSPDGKRLAYTVPQRGAVEIRDTVTWRLVSQIRLPAAADEVTFSPHWDRAVYVDSGRSVGLINLEDQRVLWTHTQHSRFPGEIVAYSPRGDVIACIGELNDRTMWEHKDGSVTVTGGVAELLDAATGRTLHKLPGNWIETIAISPDGKTVCTASGIDDLAGRMGNGGVIRLFDTQTGRLLWTAHLAVSDLLIGSIAYSPNGRAIVVRAIDGNVELRSARNGELVRTLKRLGRGRDAYRSSTSLVAWSPDGRLIASGDEGVVLLWDVESQSL